MPNIGLGIQVNLKNSAAWYPTRLHNQSLGDITLWYDPSDLSTMFTDVTGTTNVTADGDSVALMLDKGGLWDGRGVVNRLLRSQEFSSSSWVKRGTCTVTADATTAPDGSLTADLISGIGAVSTNDIYQLNASVGTLAAPAVLSIYIKRVSTSGTLTFQNSHNSVRGEYTVDMSLLSDDWERITPDHPAVTVVKSFSGHTAGVIGLLIGATAGAPLSAYFWGAQIELGVTVTAYQANGATVGGPGYHRVQATGTSMPKYKTGPNPAAAENSPELVTNGGFDADTAWVKGATTVISGGVASSTATPASSNVVQQSAMQPGAGKDVRVQFTVSNWTGGGLRVFINNDFIDLAGKNGTYIFTMYSTLGAGSGLLIRALTSAFTGDIDNISVKEIPASAPYIHWLLYDGTDDGHATGTIPFNTVTSDGLARRNIFDNPVDFAHTVWDKSTVTTIVSNAIEAPDGTISADQMVETAVNNNHFIRPPSGITVSNATAYTLSIYAKKGTRDFVSLSNDGSARSWFNITSGTVGTVHASHSANIIDVGGGWYRCSITFTTTTTTTQPYIYINSANNQLIYLGVVSDYIYIWGAQLELGSTATDFQNIGTDEVSVCAGVTKSSDAATGMFFESGVSTASTNGSFAIQAPDGTLPGYAFISRGTTRVFADAISGFPAPTTNVLSGASDVGNDSALIRIDGVQIEETATDQGTGNFGSYPLYFGRRGGSSLPFNGREYQTVIRSRLLSAPELYKLEQFVARKSGVIL